MSLLSRLPVGTSRGELTRVPTRFALSLSLIASCVAQLPRMSDAIAINVVRPIHRQVPAPRRDFAGADVGGAEGLWGSPPISKVVNPSFWPPFKQSDILSVAGKGSAAGKGRGIESFSCSHRVTS